MPRKKTAYRKKKRPNFTLIEAFLQPPVLSVIVEAAHHFGMVLNLDMSLSWLSKEF